MAKNQEVDQELEAQAAAALARVKKKDHAEIPENDEQQPDAVVESFDEDEDDGVVLATEAPKKETPKITEDDDDVYHLMPDVPKGEAESFLKEVNPEIDKFRKELIIEEGLTPAEAATAARKRLEKKAKEKNDAYLEDHPKLGIIEIDATKEKDLNLDAATLDKLHKVRALRLVLVENKELDSLKILPRGENEEKSRYRTKLFRGINSSLSHYSVPMPCLGDYMTFNGAQAITLLGATALDQDSSYTSLEKKAKLLYECFYDGTEIHKYNEKSEIALTFEEFCNLYKYDDVAMGIYAIAVASSMEVCESPMRCVKDNCRKDFDAKFNIKSLLDMSQVNEYYQNRSSEIDKHRNHPDVIKKMVAEHREELRMKSPTSNNVYTICHPSLAKALKVYEKFDESDIKQYGVIVLAMYLSQVLIYDKENGGYYEVDMDDVDEVVEVLTALPQLDISLLNKYLSDQTYTPRFVLKTTCPYCGNVHTEDVSVDQILFLKARDSSMEIK